MNSSINKHSSIYSFKLTVRYWISVFRNKFFDSLNLIRCSLIAFCKNCSKSSYSAVYDRVSSSFLLIHAFSREKNVSMKLKSDEYEDKRAKMISTASHIWMKSLFQWIRALFKIKIDLRLSYIVKMHCESIWFRTKSLKMIAVMLFWCICQAI
jgi:hypothetical protein